MLPQKTNNVKSYDQEAQVFQLRYPEKIATSKNPIHQDKKSPQ